MSKDWFHKGEYIPHPFGNGKRGEVQRRKDRRALEAEKVLRHRKEREARGRDATVAPDETDIRQGLSSPEWRRLHAEALVKDEPYDDYPHMTALREQYIRQLLNGYQRNGVPRE